MAGRRIEMMAENRVKLIAAARKAFAEKGFVLVSTFTVSVVPIP